MPSRYRAATGAFIAAAALVATPTQASNEQTIYLRAYVPVYCNVELLPGVAQQGSGLVTLGQSMELCNAPRGYRVILQHPAGLTDATLISDASRIPLSETGETVLVDSDHPNLKVRQLALDLGEETGQIDRLGLRIEVNY